ncbi:MAG: hypothetical protein COB23_00350 [Methylophaga sp.]|nr:MAG: hypothetical protein COB23_00350 [Methylophaga sp.]
MKLLILEPEKLERSDGNIIRRCTVKREDDNAQVDLQTLWFQFPETIKLPEDSDCDSYLLALLMDAMYENRKIIVKGSVSQILLSNLVEYQSAWHKWLPDVYHIVDIGVESIRDNDGPVPGAICAFSGGVDATFSVWRHSQKRNSYRSQTINLCAFVHGFDIPLSDEMAFESANNIAIETLRDIDISLIPVKTNYREISNVNWEHSHGCALVATLSHFKHVAGTCIVGSSDPYDKLDVAWGSSPITDHLLGSDGFRVMHDGSSHYRVEKVKEILDWKVGAHNLRVCWQGELKDRNCGKCEKCLRTQCNFLANGSAIPSCFPKKGSKNINLEHLSIYKEGLRLEWIQNLNFALKNKIQQPWVSQLTIIHANKKRLVDIVFPQGSFRRKVIRKVKSNFKRE